MSIQATKEIKKNLAIRRIIDMGKLIKNNEFDKIKSNSDEVIKFKDFKDSNFLYRCHDSTFICWSFPKAIYYSDAGVYELDNDSIGDLLSFPYFRFSQYENYEIIDD